VGGDERCEGLEFAALDVNLEDVDERVTYQSAANAKAQFRDERGPGCGERERAPLSSMSESSVHHLG
jgi:hypothetical protein